MKSHVHWPSFLSRHDLSWQWDWSSSSLYTLQPRASSLSKCGKGADTVGRCCLAANTTNNDDAAASSASAVVLALCDPTSNNKAQQWLLTPSGAYINQHNKLCLQDNHGAQQLLGQCNISSVHQQWRIMDGYLYVMWRGEQRARTREKDHPLFSPYAGQRTTSRPPPGGKNNRITCCCTCLSFSFFIFFPPSTDTTRRAPIAFKYKRLLLFAQAQFVQTVW